MNENKDVTNGRFSRNPSEKIRRMLEAKYSQFEMIGEYDHADGHFYLMCKDCGTAFKHSADILRPSRSKQIFCKNCQKIMADARERARAQAKAQEQQSAREIQKMKASGQKKFSQNIFHVCPICKTIFIHNRQTYCSRECAAYADSRRHTKKKEAYRYLVPLMKLYERDKGICWICGEQCDLSDAWEIDGVQYFGDNYPSRDHVIPKSKGGVDSWENIKLAHRGCNTMKRDRILPGRSA